MPKADLSCPFSGCTQFPKTLGNINPNVLNPRNAWADKAKYDETRSNLAKKFVANYKQYVAPGVVCRSCFTYLVLSVCLCVCSCCGDAIGDCARGHACVPLPGEGGGGGGGF